MTFYTHSILGVFISVILVQLLNFFGLVFISLFGSASLQIYGGAILGALIPDLDQRNSKLSRYLPLITWVLKFLGIRHRGFSHSLLGFLLASIFAFLLFDSGYLSVFIVLGFLVGYLSHIISDLFNPGGVILLFPYGKKYSLGSIRVGSGAENLLFLLISFLLVLIIYGKDGTLNLIFNLIHSLRSGF